MKITYWVLKRIGSCGGPRSAMYWDLKHVGFDLTYNSCFALLVISLFYFKFDNIADSNFAC